jgi:PAS domain S-box-containing protein
MQRPFDGDDHDLQISRLIGFGEFSSHKSYYPELVRKIDELEEERSRLASIFENAQDGICRLTPKGRILEANASMGRICGFADEKDLLDSGLNLARDFLQDAGQWDRFMGLLNQSGKVRGFEAGIRRCSGESAWCSTSAVLQEGDKGQVFIDAFFHDITETIHHREEIKKLKNYLDNIVNSMPSALVGVDAGGCITSLNREARSRSGVNFDQAMAKPLDRVFPALEPVMDQIKKALGRRQAWHRRLVSRTKSGEVRHEELVVYPLVTNGIQGAVIRMDDVTERIRMEEMMIQAEKMMSVGGLAAGMAHEIKNPLSIILQNAQVMSSRLRPALDKNRTTALECGTTIEAVEAFMEKRGVFRMLNAVVEGGRRATRIVESMLSFSRKSGAGKMAHDVRVILDESIELASKDYDLKKDYDFRRIGIVRRYDEVPDIQCDFGKLQQVFLNILKNGAQAMAENAAQDVERSPKFVLQISMEQDMLRVVIQDNGPGMDEHLRKRIFEPFFTTKDVGRGTGLGLSVSYFIVTEDHGGTMEVESQPDQGTRFIIRLPVKSKG